MVKKASKIKLPPENQTLCLLESHAYEVLCAISINTEQLPSLAAMHGATQPAESNVLR